MKIVDGSVSLLLSIDDHCSVAADSLWFCAWREEASVPHDHEVAQIQEVFLEWVSSVLRIRCGLIVVMIAHRNFRPQSLQITVIFISIIEAIIVTQLSELVCWSLLGCSPLLYGWSCVFPVVFTFLHSIIQCCNTAIYGPWLGQIIPAGVPLQFAVSHRQEPFGLEDVRRWAYRGRSCSAHMLPNARVLLQLPALLAWLLLFLLLSCCLDDLLLLRTHLLLLLSEVSLYRAGQKGLGVLHRSMHVTLQISAMLERTSHHHL